MKHKSGFVNIIGRPNIGKSTLMNRLVGERMAITTAKPQTTRHRILALVNGDDYQIVFSDSPGIVNDPAYKLHKSLNSAAYSSFEDADILIMMTDPFDPKEDLLKLSHRLNNLDVPKILVLNKIDLLKEEQLDQVEAHWRKMFKWDAVYRISALKGDSVDELMERIIETLPEGPAYYPKDQLTDRPERFFVTEIIREELLLQYKQEIPYACQVEIDYFQESEDITRIAATIYVARDSQKPIIIGKGGQSIKKLGTASRLKIVDFLDTKIYLELHVKVRKGWRDNEQILEQFGY